MRILGTWKDLLVRSGKEGKQNIMDKGFLNCDEHELSQNTVQVLKTVIPLDVTALSIDRVLAKSFSEHTDLLLLLTSSESCRLLMLGCLSLLLLSCQMLELV